MKEPKLPSRKTTRLPSYDYCSAGMYFITLCTEKRKCFFGKIIEEKMMLSPIGKIVEKEWLKTSQIRENVFLDEFIVMPNHLHGIIVIDEKIKSCSLGNIILQFKSTTTKKIRKNFNMPEGKIWQRNYYEHVIRNENSLSALQEYIINNPLAWHLDELYSST